MKDFSDLTEQELPALAISLEEEDNRTYATSLRRCALADAAGRAGRRARRRDLDGFRRGLVGQWFAHRLRQPAGARRGLWRDDDPGRLGPPLPFLIPNFPTAIALAIVVVMVELAVSAWVRNRFMDTPLLSAAFQVVVGGLLVFGTGVLIGFLGERSRDGSRWLRRPRQPALPVLRRGGGPRKPGRLTA